MRHLIISALVTVALAAGSSPAQERSAVVAKPLDAGISADHAAPSPATAMPACLEQLKLTAEQQNQVRAIVDDYEVDVASVWKQFSSRYGEAIRAEAMLLTAIEDNLTEPQRMQVREQRRRVAQHEKKRAANSDQPIQPAAKPVSAVERELAIVGVSLTPEQESAADRVQETYLSRLRTLNRDIQGLHTRLVSLEADKFTEIEKVLTKGQLQQLCEIRKSAPPAVAVEGSQGN